MIIASHWAQTDTDESWLSSYETSLHPTELLFKLFTCFLFFVFFWPLLQNFHQFINFRCVSETTTLRKVSHPWSKTAEFRKKKSNSLKQTTVALKCADTFLFKILHDCISPLLSLKLMNMKLSKNSELGSFKKVQKLLQYSLNPKTTNAHTRSHVIIASKTNQNMHESKISL